MSWVLIRLGGFGGLACLGRWRSSTSAIRLVAVHSQKRSCAFSLYKTKFVHKRRNSTGVGLSRLIDSV